jgi:hypothetical protein
MIAANARFSGNSSIHVPPMTKAELLARIASDPMIIEPVANLSYFRVALHGDADRTNCVILGVGPGGDTRSADEYEHPYACVNGKTMRLTYREAELIAARLRSIVGDGCVPRGTTTGDSARPRRGWRLLRGN